MSRTKDVGDYVGKKIEGFAKNEYLARSRLAVLQRGAGKAPGEIPEIFGTVLRGMPSGFIGEDGAASKEEWACFTALTLFALHQQGNNVEKNCVNTKNYVSIGTAAGKLKATQADANADERILGRIRQITSASDISGAAWHLRSLIQLFKKNGIKINYQLLAEDLYTWQFPDGKNKISLKWGQDFFRKTKTEDKEDEE